MHKQTDGVNMGIYLGPVIANIIGTQCENVIFYELIEKTIVKFYIKLVDDTLLVIGKNGIKIVLNKFNSVNKNLQFTIDIFGNCASYFMDIEILQ